MPESNRANDLLQAVLRKFSAEIGAAEETYTNICKAGGDFRLAGMDFMATLAHIVANPLFISGYESPEALVEAISLLSVVMNARLLYLKDQVDRHLPPKPFRLT